MAEFLLFTLIVAIGSVYLALPKHRKIRLLASLGGWPFRIAAIITGTLVIINIVRPVILEKLTLLEQPFQVSIGVGVIESIELVLAFITLLLFLSLAIKDEVAVRRDEYLASKLRELYNKGEHGILSDIIEDNYSTLISHPQRPQRPSLWGYLNSQGISSFIVEEQHQEEIGPLDRLQEKVNRVRWKILAWTKYYYRTINYRVRNTCEESAQYAHSRLLTEDFVESVALTNPKLGIKIIQDQEANLRRKKFSHKFLKALQESENSILYKEISNETNVEPKVLLPVLFDDFERLKNLAIISPITEVTESAITARSNGEDNYNHYWDYDALDVEYTSEPISLGIEFFNDMVHEALEAREETPLWISNYRFFCEKICQNYQITNRSKPDAEFPNYYSYLFYRMMDNLYRWLNSVESLDGLEDSDDNLTIAEERNQMNIPTSACKTMIKCHRVILTEPTIPDKFKANITEIMLHNVIRLYESGRDSLHFSYAEEILSRLNHELSDSAYKQEFQRIYYDRGSARRGNVRTYLITKDHTMTGLVNDLDCIITYREFLSQDEVEQYS
jgi:hypothetical protein